MSLLILSASDVDTIASALSPEDLQLLMAKVFLRLSNPLGKNAISLPPRIAFPTANHTALFMPARIGPPSLATAGNAVTQSSSNQEAVVTPLGDTAIKVVCVPGKADSRGLPGTTLVLDEETGGVKAVVNARKLTALRNAAGSLLSTSLVGPSRPISVVAFGAGQQIDSHLDLHIRHFPSISQCTFINRTLNDRAKSLRDKLTSRFPRVTVKLLSSDLNGQEQDVADVERAVQGADIIICATSSNSPLFPSSWVKTGAHVILIGSYTPQMREVDKALVLRALGRPLYTSSATRNTTNPFLLVDSREACLHEAGELIDAQVTSEQMSELGELVPKDEDGNLDIDSYRRHLSFVRSQPKEKDDYGGPISVFKSVGIGLQDVAIAGAIVDKALFLGEKIGTTISDYDRQIW